MMMMKKKKKRRRSKSYAWNGDDDDNDTPRAMMIDGRKSGESETRFHDVSEYLSSSGEANESDYDIDELLDGDYFESDVDEDFFDTRSRLSSINSVSSTTTTTTKRVVVVVVEENSGELRTKRHSRFGPRQSSATIRACRIARGG